jgi:RimJ/RimL family protein N-acetyltransferase
MKEIKTIIEGERVLIKKLRLGDAGDIYAHIKGREIARWTRALPHPYPKDGAEKFIRKSQRQWRDKKVFNFGIVLKETGKVIGGIGLVRVDWKHQCAELGYWIGRKYWGKGLITEATRLMLKFGFHELKLHRIYAAAFESNIGSCRVLEKCGFQLEGIRREAVVKYKKRHNFIDYGILRSEFKN